jgi:hypothetical protein
MTTARMDVDGTSPVEAGTPISSPRPYGAPSPTPRYQHHAAPTASAITEALEAIDRNNRKVMMFLRHKDPKVLMKYDDNRKDIAGGITYRN